MSYRSLFKQSVPKRSHLQPIDTTVTIARPINVFTTSGRYLGTTKYHLSCRDAVRSFARTTNVSIANIRAEYA